MSNFDIDHHRLQTYLEAHIPGFKGPLRAEKFDTGQSNPTFRLETGSGRYVMRRKPPGELLQSAHAVDREYRVMSALNQTAVPVPQMVHLCEDESVIGSMFYVMEYVDGRSFSDPCLLNASDSERQQAYDSMTSTLAAIHNVDIDAVGLSHYSKRSEYYQRQMNRWNEQYPRVETEPKPDMHFLLQWLTDNSPTRSDITLVHGDYKPDNLLLHAERYDIAAVLDWELSTLGDPLADFAYFCAMLRLPNDAPIRGLGGVDRAALGIPSEQTMINQYCQLRGLSDIPDWHFYLAFNLFRNAAILEGVKHRALQGNASSERAMQFGDLVQPIASMAVELVKTA